MQLEAKALTVRYVIFGGEALYPGNFEKWNERYPNCRLMNLYGITETTVHVLWSEITIEDISPRESE